MATKTTSKPSFIPSKSAAKAAPAPAPAKAAPAPVKPAAPAPGKAKAPYQPTQDEIAARAYEIYEREGGNDHDNWLRAERELIARGRK
jgi:hypothetical protein